MTILPVGINTPYQNRNKVSFKGGGRLTAEDIAKLPAHIRAQIFETQKSALVGSMSEESQKMLADILQGLSGKLSEVQSFLSGIESKYPPDVATFLKGLTQPIRQLGDKIRDTASVLPSPENGQKAIAGDVHAKFKEVLRPKSKKFDAFMALLDAKDFKKEQVEKMLEHIKPLHPDFQVPLVKRIAEFAVAKKDKRLLRNLFNSAYLDSNKKLSIKHIAESISNLLKSAIKLDDQELADKICYLYTQNRFTMKNISKAKVKSLNNMAVNTGIKSKNPNLVIGIIRSIYHHDRKYSNVELEHLFIHYIDISSPPESMTSWMAPHIQENLHKELDTLVEMLPKGAKSRVLKKIDTLKGKKEW